MKDILSRIAKLIDVKSIITITLTFVFVYLSVNQIVSVEFMTIFTTIIGFYFGTQYEKSKKDDDKIDKV